MITKKQLEEVVLEQKETFSAKNSGIPREIDLIKDMTSPQIVVISGARRSGKSTLLKQISEHLSDFYYINFDDERLLNFQVSNFNDLLIVWQKQFPSKNILFDEIQNVPSWERFVRRIYEEGYKIFLTGSNAKLLSSELATHLTGRYQKIELYPFSFSEKLTLAGVESNKLTSKNRALILNNFNDYLISGGFPEYLKNPDPEIFTRLYEDVIYKDIIVRFSIRDVKAFRQLANWLFTNFSKKISYNNLKKILEIKSPVSVKNYISFLNEAYLVFELFKYDFSLKKQAQADKKIYVIDNGLRNQVAFSFSEDRGRLLENLVFLELKRRGKDIFYFSEKKECDFVIVSKGKITQAIQVTQEINKSNEDREIGGLIAALDKFNLSEGWLLTEDQEEERVVDGKKIKIIPIWEWLLENK